MSRIPGPTQADPLSLRPPSRTPGTLGVNDAAEPFRGAKPGDTPGSLGVNDHASALAGGRRKAPQPSPASGDPVLNEFLDSVCDWDNLPGAALAWNSEGHRFMTSRAAVSDAEDMMMEDALPPKFLRERIYAVLKLLPPDVVNVDVTPEQWTDLGQRQHFMRYKGQSKIAAYQMGLQKVLGPLASAVRAFQNKKSADDVASILAESVHALQDSFSPGHVERTARGKKLVITDIFVWADQDKKKHEAADETWQNSDGSLTDIGQACVMATRFLLEVFIMSAINREDDASRARSTLLDQYLSEQLNRNEPAHSPILLDDLPSVDSFQTPPTPGPEIVVTGGKTVVVKAGDTLSGIAQSEYGRWQLWPLIYDLNKAKIGPNPNRIQPDLRLMVLPLETYSPEEKAAAEKRAPTWKAFGS
jgi:nucleoid-associated protein YgaU